ncbi:GntR family transcriptional regulator [Streptomyces sp. MS2.AVA.5]|uniref:GntR family transcriptional regulator n=1 Tax=Streptomyces achmelvichensis TaxID=3134111 RepID=A0ACC6PL02_9ACTN
MVIQSVPSRRHVIADDLRKQISTGHIKASERLPSEAQLASHYTVSTPTLRSALAGLQGENIHDKGNFVCHPLRRITYVGGGRMLDARTTADAALRVSPHHQGPGAWASDRSAEGGGKQPLTEFSCLSREGVEARLADLRPPLAEVQETVSVRLPTSEELATLRISSSLAALAITRVAADTTGRGLPGNRANAVFTIHHATGEEGAEG